MKLKNIVRTLVISTTSLLALLELNACTNDKDYVRNRYDKLEDCLKDYSKEECEEQQNQQVVHSGGGWYPYYYYGPWYHHTYLGTMASGRTSVGNTYSTVASHIVNTEGAAVARSSFSSIGKGGISGFTRGGFGATAKGFSVGT